MNFSDEMLEDIHGYCIEHKSFYKNEILLTYGISEEHYSALKDEVLSRFRDLEAGPHKMGGFQLKARRYKETTEDEGFNAGPQIAWEVETVKILSQRVQYNHLEEMLGPLKGALRAYRQEIYGEDRRGSKEELAHALMAAFGQDLLQDSERRKIIGKALGVKSKDIPARWIAGRAIPRRFVEAAKLPKVLAGVPCNEREEDIEILEGQAQLPPLEEFQKEVKRKALRISKEPGSRAIVSLPTGAGKTRVAVETIRDYIAEQKGENFTVVWLAHTEELCEQAAQSFREVWHASSHSPITELVRFWGRYTRDVTSHDFNDVLYSPEPQILISTPQRLLNFLKTDTSFNHKLTKGFIFDAKLIVIDEAHRAAAPTYRELIDRISAKPDSKPVVIGLTATPYRGEYHPTEPSKGTEDLREIFGSLITPEETLKWPFYRSLQEMGILSHADHREFLTNISIKLPDNLSDAYMDIVLRIKTDRNKRRMAILPEVVKAAKAEDSSVLYFGPSVEDAAAMTFLLRKEGILAASVFGSTNTGTRQRVIEDFRAKRIKVLCNCEVLTTGFDAPRVTHVVMARPTVSQVLYEQMIGRGLRGARFGGTERVEIIDCIDKYTANKPFLGYDQHFKVWGKELT